jgi:UDP-N-acetylmuramoylalanine--D-glutamate ligase
MSRGRAVVIGLGRSGAACARVLDAEGYAVLVVDQGDNEELRALAATLPESVEVVLGGYSDDVAAGASMVCPSPGVRWDAPVLEVARAHGVAVRSEMDLVFERCRAHIAGVTGTNGKTTTTSLIGAILTAAGGATVHVGGNIGETVLDRLDAIRDGDWLVLELSSFQLESISRPRCRLATVLNVTPDHLDRHGDMARYIAAKQRIVEFADPGGVVVLNADDPITRGMASSSKAPVRLFGGGLVDVDGATVVDGRIVSLEGGESRPVMPVADIPLFGAHNVSNVLAAVAMTRAADTPVEVIARAVRDFTAVAHRLEPVLEHDGVLWVNDSKATNAESAIVALHAFGERPIVWIGGGGRKGVGPDELVDEVARRARHAIVCGATGPELDAALAARNYTARTMVATLREAVAVAAGIAGDGDVVLLAPGYTSFDQFRSFEERGTVFATMVRELHGVAGSQPAAVDGRGR